jgi:CheY-specific phosphatase CheX
VKNKAGLIVPLCMILFGVYALFTALTTTGEQVTLISNHALPRGLSLMIGLIGLAGGAVVMFTSLSSKKTSLSN